MIGPTLVEKYSRLTRKIVYKFAQQYRLESDELLSVANTHLVSYAQDAYDPSKGSEITWVYTVVVGCLRDYCKKERLTLSRQVSIYQENEDGEELQNDIETPQTFVAKLLRELSAESAFIIRLILSAPVELKGVLHTYTKNKARKAVYKVLTEKYGWSNAQVSKCFREIEEAI